LPEDISLVSFGGLARNTAALRSITSVTIDETQIGHRAAELLDRMRRRELPLDCSEVFESPIRLSEGRTLGAAPRGPRAPR
jgi:DNA-binding LacI/PurR family transcriptional regulator